MNTLMKQRLLPVALLLLLSPAVAFTQERPDAKSRPDGRKVFTDLMKPYRNLNDYTVRIQAKADIPTIRVPDFTATLYFKKPDRFHIETKSFAPLPKNSGLFNPFQFDPAKNLIDYQRTESLGGVQADLYRVEPRDRKSPVRYSTIWVGKSPVRILQVESLTFRGTTVLVKLSYRNVEQGGEMWLLPDKVHVHLTFPEGASNPDAWSLTTRDNPVSGGMRRLDEVSGEGDLDLVYSDWKVNTGLDNRLFEKKN
ncbi:MAG: LolA-like protein [Syntrophales bacterium]